MKKMTRETADIMMDVMLELHCELLADEAHEEWWYHE